MPHKITYTQRTQPMDSVSPLWIARPNTAIATQDSSANSAEAPNSTRWETMSPKRLKIASEQTATSTH